MVVIKTTSSYWDKTTRWPNLGNIDLWSQSGTYHQSDQGFQPHILVIDTTTSPSLASDVCSTCLPCCTSVWLSLSAVSVNHDHSPTHSKRHKLREMPDTRSNLCHHPLILPPRTALPFISLALCESLHRIFLARKRRVGRIVVVALGTVGARADPYLCHTSAHPFAKASHLPRWTSRRSVRPLILAFPLILHKHTL